MSFCMLNMAYLATYWANKLDELAILGYSILVKAISGKSGFRMSHYVLDYKALGLHPDWENILIELIDLELGHTDNPQRRFILNYILLGYSHREIARMGISRDRINKELRLIGQERKRL